MYYLSSNVWRGIYNTPFIFFFRATHGIKKRITRDSLDRPNGHQYHATPEQVDSLLSHVLNYRSPYADLRPEVRRIEEKFLDEYAGLLIGNQCLDFAKQDGVTEIEECIMANSVERKMNDVLFDDERVGRVIIDRRTIFVSW